MGGRGASGSIGARSSSSESTTTALKEGQLGSQIGTQTNNSSLLNLVEKNLNGESLERYKLQGLKDNLKEGKNTTYSNEPPYTIEKSTEKANLISWSYTTPDGDGHDTKMWVPKSVMPKEEPIYNAIGKYKVGDNVNTGKWGGKITSITQTHTFVKTSSGNTLKINNDNLKKYFGK